MGVSKSSHTPCRIPKMKQSPGLTPPQRSPSSSPSLRKSFSGRYNGRAIEGVNYKQPSARAVRQPSETSYLPPQRGSSRQHNPSFEKDFGPFGSVHQHQPRQYNSYSNNDNSTETMEDIDSMFQRPEYDSRVTRSERLAGSFRLIEAARNTEPVKSNDYGVTKTWDTGLMHDNSNGRENSNPLLRSQLPPPNQPIVSGSSSGPSSSRRSLNRSEDLDRILAKYGKTSKSSVNKDPDFTAVVRTDTTLRVTTDQYCKPSMHPGPGIHPYWNSQPQLRQSQKHGDDDILSKLQDAVRQREDVHEQLTEKTLQLPGADGSVTAPMHPINSKVIQVHNNPSNLSHRHYHHPNDKQQEMNQSTCMLKRSTHVFPFKETASGHLVIDPLQIAFESRKISVLVSDPNNNTATVEFTTTKCGAKGLDFQPAAGTQSFTNKNERILHEVKKAMSIQETNENNAMGRNLTTKLSHHQQPKELNQKKYSNSTKATPEFEENILSKLVSGRKADTHVVIGEKIFPCHSLALESFSTYFERLSRPPEAIQKIQISETEVSASAFPVLMDWIVQSEEGRKQVVAKENLVPVYAAAKHLGMKDLELQCVRFLERKVDSSDPDLLTMWEDVKRRQPLCVELVKIIASKMAASYHEIFKAERYLRMEVDELSMLLSSDDISIESEMDVYDSAVAWLLHDWKTRKIHTNKIMSTVRFGLLSPLQLTQINLCPAINKVINEKDYNQIIAYGSVKSMIDEGLSFSILGESYKSQPEELKKWVEKTGVKAPTPRNCLVNKKQGSQLILEKISLLEDASQTKLRANFGKPPEKSSSYTLLDTLPMSGTPCIESSNNFEGSGKSSNTSNEGDGFSSKDQMAKSRIPKFTGNGSFTDRASKNSDSYILQTSVPLYSEGSGMIVQELSRPKLLSNSSNTLQHVGSDTKEAIPIAHDENSYSPDIYSTSDYYRQNSSVK